MGHAIGNFIIQDKLQKRNTRQYWTVTLYYITILFFKKPQDVYMH